jgi:hypothetical protein
VHREEPDRAEAEHERRDGDEGVRGVDVAAQEEPGDPAAEVPPAQAPLVEVVELARPPPPRGDEAEHGHEQEQRDDDDQLD